MSYQIDPKTEDIHFLFKFQEGVCSSSFGIKVAKHGGIPQKVIDIALQKSGNFNKKLGELTKKLEDHEKEFE